MDGWMLCKYRGAGEGAAPPPPRKPSIYGKLEKTAVRFLCSLVAWFVGLAALVLGWLVGWLALR